jgi:hypothetical protein
MQLQNPPKKQCMATRAPYVTQSPSKVVCAACAADSIFEPCDVHQQGFISFLDREMDLSHHNIHNNNDDDIGLSDDEGSEDKFVPVSIPEENWMHVSIDNFINYMSTPPTPSRDPVALALEYSNQLAEGTARLSEIATRDASVVSAVSDTDNSASIHTKKGAVGVSMLQTSVAEFQDIDNSGATQRPQDGSLSDTTPVETLPACGERKSSAYRGVVSSVCKLLDLSSGYQVVSVWGCNFAYQGLWHVDRSHT